MPLTLTPADVDVCRRLAWLRAAPSSALYVLALKPHYSSERAARARLALLVEHKVLQHADIAGTKKSIYFLNTAAFRLIPDLTTLASDNDRKPPTDAIASFCHLRATVYASLTADGFVVSSDAAGLQTLRRHLLEKQRARLKAAAPAEVARLQTTLTRLEASSSLHVPTHDPWTCSTCGHVGMMPAPHTAPAADGTTRPCTGTMRKRPLLSYAVAARGKDVWAVLVDHPYRSIDEQLAELPARLPQQPSLDLFFRSSDDGTVYDSVRGEFRHKGPRQRALERAFSPHDNPAVFPFWETVNVVHYRPELQHRVINRRSSHEEAA
jgi:hypothetical protein